MKPDIIRQPLLLAIASLLVVIAAAMTTGTVISPAPETVISTPLGDLIGLFQERFPRCSRIFCGSLLLLTGILCGRLAVRYGLYPVSSTLTIPLLRTGRLRNPSGSGVSDGIRHSVHPAVIDPKFLRLFPQRLRDRGRIPGFVFPGTAAAALRPASPPAAVDPGRSILFPPDPARSLRIALRCHTAFPRCLLRRLGPGSQSRGHPRRLMALLRQRQRIPDFRQYSSACPRNSRDRPFYRTLRRIFRTHQFPCDKYQSTGHADLYHPALHGDGKPDGGTERHPGAAGRRSRTCSTAHAPDLHSHPTHRRNAPVPCFVFRLHCKYIAIKSASNVEIVHILTFSI